MKFVLGSTHTQAGGGETTGKKRRKQQQRQKTGRGAHNTRRQNKGRKTGGGRKHTGTPNPGMQKSNQPKAKQATKQNDSSEKTEAGQHRGGTNTFLRSGHGRGVEWVGKRAGRKPKFKIKLLFMIDSWPYGLFLVLSCAWSYIPTGTKSRQASGHCSTPLYTGMAGSESIHATEHTDGTHKSLGLRPTHTDD